MHGAGRQSFAARLRSSIAPPAGEVQGRAQTAVTPAIERLLDSPDLVGYLIHQLDTLSRVVEG
jgi:hypothetical protein